jgi:oligopeptide transport system ATP-binding protein
VSDVAPALPTKSDRPPTPPQVRALQVFLAALTALDVATVAHLYGGTTPEAAALATDGGLLVVAAIAFLASLLLNRLINAVRLVIVGLIVIESLALVAAIFIPGALYGPTTISGLLVSIICLYLARSDDVVQASRVAAEGGVERALIDVPAQLPDRPGEAARDVLYSVRGLTKHFPIRGGLLNREVAAVQAVEDVSFDIYRGETIGLVGESGCGKTTTGRLLLRLLEATEGNLVFEGRDIRKLTYQELKPFRAKMQIIFQDPYASLNPRLPVGDIIGEGLFNFGVKRAAERERRVAEMLEIVGLRKYYINRYPHEFSGGQRQRIGIARALVLRPSFVVADEPVSALDVSIQAQVLNLLKDLQEELKLTYVFISHNLSVVEHIADRVGVMYLGKLVELSDSAELYHHPKHPYTQALLSAVPIPDPEQRRERILLAGDVPSPINPPTGCRFHTRCPLRAKLMERDPKLGEVCTTTDPAFEPKAEDKRHLVACHYADSPVEQELEQKVAF